MRPYPYTQNYPSANYAYASPLNGALAMGIAGALITGSVAAASEFRKVKEAQTSQADALAAVGKEALGGGVAWAAGAVVGNTLFRSNVLSIITTTAVAAGVKYAIDGFAASRQPASKAAPKQSKTAK